MTVECPRCSATVWKRTVNDVGGESGGSSHTSEVEVERKCVRCDLPYTDRHGEDEIEKSSSFCVIDLSTIRAFPKFGNEGNDRYAMVSVACSNDFQNFVSEKARPYSHETDDTFYIDVVSLYEFQHTIRKHHRGITVLGGELHEGPRLLHDNWDYLRKFVYKRDDYACTQCGESDVELHCHHVQGKGAGYTIDNLATLCYNCHADEHQWL